MKNLQLLFTLATLTTFIPYNAQAAEQKDPLVPLNVQMNDKKEPEPQPWGDWFADLLFRSARQKCTNKIKDGSLSTYDLKEQRTKFFAAGDDLIEKMTKETDRLEHLQILAKYNRDNYQTIEFPPDIKQKMMVIAMKRGAIAGDIVRSLSPKDARPTEPSRVKNLTQFITPFIKADEIPEILSNLMTEEQCQAVAEQFLQKLIANGKLPAMLAKTLDKEQTTSLYTTILMLRNAKLAQENQHKTTINAAGRRMLSASESEVEVTASEDDDEDAEESKKAGSPLMAPSFPIPFNPGGRTLRDMQPTR